MIEVNIETGHPNSSQAMMLLQGGIVRAKRAGAHELKVIHGYGSTGTGGGILKRECHRTLMNYKKSGYIKDFCSGEKFGPFSDEGRRITDKYPNLKRDRDWARLNDGITIVVI